MRKSTLLLKSGGMLDYENYIRNHNYFRYYVLFIQFLMKERLYFVLIIVLIQMVAGYGFGGGSFCNGN
jgi:hypothetical protein